MEGMRCLRYPFAAAMVVFALLVLACGGDSKKPATATNDGPAPAVATGTPATDEEYLAVFCAGATHYQEAVNTEKTADGIANAIKEYIAVMRKVVPPDDLRDFQGSYLKYLQDAVPDPTSLLTKAAPLPADGPRTRLAGKASNVPECKYPNFLNPQTPR